MHLTFYGFTRDPFGAALGSAPVLLSSSQRKALEVIRHGVESRVGLMMITAEPGLGKTTLARSAAQSLASQGVKAIVAPDPRSSPEELLKLVFDHLELGYPHGEEQFELLRLLHDGLADEHRRGGNVALLIDEAQDLPGDVLESLRLLSDLEMDNDKLIQIVLLGRRPHLEKRLEAFELRQLTQRIAYRATLSSLTVRETVDYINHRIDAALNAQADRPLSESAVEEIARHGHGIPGRIHLLCDRTLAAGFALGCRPIRGDVARQAITELEGSRPKRWIKWGIAPALALAAALVVSLLPEDDPSSRKTAEDPAIESPQSREASTPPTLPRRQETRAAPVSPHEQASTADPGERAPDRSTTRDSRSTWDHSTSPADRPPKKIPPAREDAQARPASDSTVPPSAITSPTEAPPERRPISRPPDAVQPKPGEPSTGDSRSSPSGAAETPQKAREGRKGSAGPSEPTGATGDARTDAPAAAATSGRDRQGSAQDRPDPSEIIDWLIDKRTRP